MSLTTLNLGARLGPYEIVAPLGAGGMGEVYRARDTKLGRDVAIKILPPAFAEDPERLARFEREARLLASLNHPHIGAIYGVEESSGIVALVLEFIDGQPLSDRIARGALPLAESLAIARQIADALDAAHERGIVHRDLKPANIVITGDGVVKVLDFGLAKGADAPGRSGGPGGAGGSDEGLTHSPTMIAPTLDGVLLGTAPYMSPEQARGKAVDKRADIWAFGCVLYEMLTGSRAFVGETTTDVLAKIVERDPDWTVLPASTPAHIVRLIKRCLEKDPKQRLRDIGDVRHELDPTAPQSSSVLTDAPGRRRSWVPWLVAAAAVLAAVAYVRTTKSEPPDLSDQTIERLTTDSGVTAAPSLSSDGRLLAYASDRSGRGDLDIWVQQMAGGAPLRITDDAADDTDPDFSPDGSRILFRSERSGGGVYLAPALGGPARLIAPEGRHPRFAPDGTRVAYWTGQWRGNPSGTPSATYILSLAGGPPVRLVEGFNVARDPVWSPDGQSLLVLGRKDRTSPLAEAFDWWIVPVDGRPAVRSGLLDLPGWRASAGTQESRTVGGWTTAGVLAAVGGTIWMEPISSTAGRGDRRGRRLAFGSGLYVHPTISRDGRIVYAESTLERAIERAPLTSVDPQAPAVRLYTDSRPGFGRASVTRDGNVTVFERSSGHAREIWQKDLRTGAQQLVLSVDTRGVLNPTVSPDGQRIGYTVEDPSNPISVTVSGRGYVIDTAGGNPRSICDGCGVYQFLSDSLHAVTTLGDKAIRLIDVPGGSLKELIVEREGRIERPNVSPDDRWMAFRRTVGTAGKVLLVPANGTATMASALIVDEPTTTGRPCGWSPDSRTLYLLLDTDGSRCLWGQHVDPAGGHLVGQPFIVRHFHQFGASGGFGTSLGNAVTSQGFLYEVPSLRSNLWLLTSKAAR